MIDFSPFFSDYYEHPYFNPFFYLWILSSIISSMFAYLWDIILDWGLFDKNAGNNKFLREEIVYSSVVSALLLKRCPCDRGHGD